MMVVGPDQSAAAPLIDGLSDVDRFEAFWAFALSLYADREFSEVCLRLQDRCDADVTVILFLLWLAVSGEMIDVQKLQLVIKAIEPWRENVVKPMRAVRRYLKPFMESSDMIAALKLRKQIKEDELQAERVQMQILSEQFLLNPNAKVSRSKAILFARSNLGSYQTLLDRRFSQASLDVLVSTYRPVHA